MIYERSKRIMQMQTVQLVLPQVLWDKHGRVSMNEPSYLDDTEMVLWEARRLDNRQMLDPRPALNLPCVVVEWTQGRLS